ncbi:3-ketoacyl-CoA thiolase, mitochondrial-like [Aricia agestis]|uniref:3-ketoacyl-CoA thiolase, mitochondrial-like n=1 Tax=Aricia agestis TaxID=91739 RepID=UPI001C20BFA3|nr:3-ketoacyl-CoA thiolase, mitochondrial-like [Aricia agestis]
MSSSKGIFIVGAKRTPFCKYGGFLKQLTSSQIFATAAKDALQSANLDASSVDCTIIGNVHYLSQCDGGKTPRYCGIYSGVPIDRPALGVSNTCGSGLQSIISAAKDILFGMAKICLVGGTEIMSSLPLYARDVRFGSKLGNEYKLQDPLSVEIKATKELIEIEELTAEKWKIRREDCDRYTMESQLKFMKAQQAGVFVNEISNLTVTDKKKQIDVTTDDVLQELSLEELGNIPTLLKNGKFNTPANSSAPADGAAVLVLADEESVRHHNLVPLARVAGWSTVGCSESDYGLEDTVAINKLLESMKIKTAEVNYFEINERYASQAVATIQKLKIDPSVVNINGGALAMGNPTAATGARLAVHIAHQLSGSTLDKAVAATSCGIGQGVAVMFQKS